MTEQVTDVFAVATDGPMCGEVFELPIGHPQLLLHGYRYRYVGVENGVARYEYVPRR